MKTDMKNIGNSLMEIVKKINGIEDLSKYFKVDEIEAIEQASKVMTEMGYMAYKNQESKGNYLILKYAYRYSNVEVITRDNQAIRGELIIKENDSLGYYPIRIGTWRGRFEDIKQIKFLNAEE